MLSPKNPLTLFVAFLFVYLAVIYFFVSRSREAKRDPFDFCGDENRIDLTENGFNASAIVNLIPNKNSSLCRLKVLAPKTHLVSMKFIESTEGIRNSLINNETEQYPPCQLSVFLQENKNAAIWTGDPCSDSAMPDIELLTSEVKIVWSAPGNLSFARGRKLLLNSVGIGETCKKIGQHTCLKVGWDPLLCVADSLRCNGYQNCPRLSTSSDEDENLCANNLNAQSKWEQLSLELFEEKKPPPRISKNNWLLKKFEEHNITIDTKILEKVLRTTPPPSNYQTTKKTKSTSESISSAFSQYGPWGYLMLGMLISGTVVLFCGIWECCFGRNKNHQETPPPTNVCTTQPVQNEITIVPPNYQDLDQPPSYITLFPNHKITEPPDTRQSTGEAASSVVISNDNGRIQSENTEDPVISCVCLPNNCAEDQVQSNGNINTDIRDTEHLSYLYY